MLPRTMVTHPGIVMTTIRLIYTNKRYKIVDFSNLYLLILIYFEEKKDSVVVSICYALQASKTISHGAQNISVLSQFILFNSLRIDVCPGIQTTNQTYRRDNFIG